MGKIFAMLLLLLIPISLFAQYEDTEPLHGDEYGAGITVAMSGFGLGGFYRFSLPNYFFVGGNVDFYMMRDPKEFTYYDYYYGPVELNKTNRLFLIPVSVELKKRLFTDTIEDNFRPYVIGLAGATFGMNFPKNNSSDPNAVHRDNEFGLTFDFAIGTGIDFTTSQDYFISIRPQYRFIYFPTAIANQKNHSNFEIRIELGKRLLNKI